VNSGFALAEFIHLGFKSRKLTFHDKSIEAPVRDLDVKRDKCTIQADAIPSTLRSGVPREKMLGRPESENNQAV
jgi:hypothetical protein